MNTPTPTSAPGEGREYHGSGLSIQDLVLSFGDITVIHGVSVEVEPGTTTCIIGPSGSGKSTLLRGINRLHEPASGAVTLAGEDAIAMKEDDLRRRVGMVFQHFNLFPDHTAEQNVMMALRNVKKMGKEEASAVARERLLDVGLAERADHKPRDLSGGQQQRVAIARALAMTPEVMLFDEATSALDPELVKGILDLMERLARQGMTMVVVTHEMAFAAQVADQVLFMDEGRVVEAGTPDQVFNNPQSERLKTFLSEVL
ncbi:amino acid ABC transporter ATP-binding protein [Corynebacterium kalidii]|uniref:Amino acid ABC transporter ATP-binding protein n=1 Tax=Corynebacterium kalidii TaxID=2931982 RepID=A0A9X1WE26_9CORY|nr:amino acid ABC transporter ATP-binding protein [Corynebacterium kalidii]MCJ7857289.1 amino acid ABC transporter ATP-binding protein [Corynebacterium kalidii]